jgi:hypothetical protein
MLYPKRHEEQGCKCYTSQIEKNSGLKVACEAANVKQQSEVKAR